MNQFEQEERDNLKRIVVQVLEEKGVGPATSDIDAEGDDRYEIALLAHSADDATIVNKINELINQFNKTLIDNRI